MCEKCEAEKKEFAEEIKVLQKDLDQASVNAEKRMGEFGAYGDVEAHLARVKASLDLFHEYLEMYKQLPAGASTLTDEAQDVGQKWLDQKIGALSLDELVYQITLLGHLQQGLTILVQRLTNDVSQRLGNSLALTKVAKATVSAMVA